MEKKDGEQENEKKEDVEKIRGYIKEMTKGKASPVAKDQVVLKHVETKKQEVSKETANLAHTLKESVIEHDHFERLSNDELTILESFMGRRLFLSRIAIITNQSRVPLGIEPFKKADLEKILGGLKNKGYIESEMVGDKEVFWLTERGEYRVQ